MKLTHLIFMSTLTCFGQHVNSQVELTLIPTNINAFEKQENVYGLIHFSTLPSVEDLISKKIDVLNFVNNTTLYVSFNSNTNFKSIENFVSFEELNPKYKLQNSVQEHINSVEEAPKSFLLYLPSNFQKNDVDRFLEMNKLTSLPNKYLPIFVRVVNLSKEGIIELSNNELVSWISVAPDYIKENKPFHLCLGADTEYGHMAEFSSNIEGSEKYLAATLGWEGAGQNCHNLNYHFKNGTPDITGNDERIAVLNAINTWQKYVSINFYEISTAGQPNCIDISWEPISHGDGNDFGPSTLAHAYYNNNGDIHFNETYTWRLQSATGGTDLYSVALHELGHSLGLNHSSLSTAVMYASYNGVPVTDLSQDDIDGIRSIYKYRSAGTNTWDKTFVGNVTKEGSNKQIVMVNTDYVQGAIRVDDLISGANLHWYYHCNFQGWMDNTDKMFLADANGDGKKDLILVNTDYAQGAIRVINLSNGLDLSWINYNAVTPNLNGWMDATDQMFVGDINGDNSEELILVNTDYTGGAIRAVNMITGLSVSYFNNGGTPSYNGWMDASDRMLIGDMNNDNKVDLVLVNTSYTGGAIRTVDLSTGLNLGSINHGGAPSFNGWMDATDKIALADVNNDGSDEVVLVNTGYTGGAIRSVNSITGANVSWLNHGGSPNYNGWMDVCDRLFAADANNDGSEDLILVNTDYAGGAIRAVNIMNGSSISLLNHGTYSGWMDGTDRMYCEDVNTNGSAELILVNTGYTGGAVRALSLLNGVNLSLTSHTGTYNGWIDGTSVDQNCYNSPIFKTGALKDEVKPTNSVEQYDEQEVSVYPIPTANELKLLVNNLEKSNYSFFITDLLGKNVFQLTNLNQGVNTIDVSSIKSGFYFVNIVDGEKINKVKIQINR